MRPTTCSTVILARACRTVVSTVQGQPRRTLTFPTLNALSISHFSPNSSRRPLSQISSTQRFPFSTTARRCIRHVDPTYDCFVPTEKSQLPKMLQMSGPPSFANVDEKNPASGFKIVALIPQGDGSVFPPGALFDGAADIANNMSTGIHDMELPTSDKQSSEIGDSSTTVSINIDDILNNSEGSYEMISLMKRKRKKMNKHKYKKFRKRTKAQRSKEKGEN